MKNYYLCVRIRAPSDKRETCKIKQIILLQPKYPFDFMMTVRCELFRMSE